MNWTGLKKNLNYLTDQKRACIDVGHEQISLRRQCELLGLGTSSYYYQPQEVDELTLTLMNLIDEEYTRHPFLGTRKMTVYLNDNGYSVNRKSVQGLYAHMGIEAVYPKPKLSVRNKEHKIFPYLLRGLKIKDKNQVWSTDITYIKLSGGFVYLVAIIDWFSRYVLDWEISTTLEADFCVDTLARVLSTGCCEIFNTYQGSQFTSNSFTGLLKQHDIQISMDGRGRALDNIFVERLWRSVKYECIYLQEFETVKEVVAELGKYFSYYNNERPHQSLGYQTPSSIYTGSGCADSIAIGGYQGGDGSTPCGIDGAKNRSN